MKRSPSPFLIRAGALILAWAITSAPGATATEAFRLLAPVDGAVVGVPSVLLVYGVPAATEVAYLRDGKPGSWKDSRVAGDVEDLRHVCVPLNEGRQQIRILRSSDEQELGRIEITYVPPHSFRTAAAEGDRRYAFHLREREATCGGCHNLPAVFETDPNKPLSPAGKVCSACHPGLDASPQLHGPVAVYACFMCHRPEYAPARFTAGISQPASCGVCHENFLARILGGKKFVHGPVAGNACLVCHDPHGGATSAMTRERTPQLCLLCHADTLPQPVERHLHGTLPCERCHNPHGGETQLLTSAAGNSFCGECHPDVAGTRAGHPIPGHPVAGTVDPSRPGRPFECLSCHRVHALEDVSQTIPGGDEVEQRGFCRKCHY